jgi:uncharacterized protein (DUF305 family)
MSKTIKLATVLAAAALTLASCITIDRSGSDSDTDSSTSTSDHNDADVEFAQDMIPHHAQAIVMSTMAKQQARDPKLRQLAADIQAAQGPEIEQMSGWLKAWGEDVPQGMPGMRGDGDQDMGMMDDDYDMPGMMTGRRMMDLDETSGFRFDRMWLQMMIEHHEGAVTMAKAEVEQGTNPEAKALAQQVVDAQVAEITEMQGMLA